jgi:hypothetical protein
LGKPYHDMPPSASLRLDTDNKARDLVSLVLKQYGLKLDDDQWTIWIDEKGSETPNAAAGFFRSSGKRWIAFNAAFMARLSEARNGDWIIYAIAAHEVSHHLGNHFLRPSLMQTKRGRQFVEREADYHAGFVLGRMGADYKPTVEVVRWLPSGGEETDYPPRSQRLCELGRGWRDGKRLISMLPVLCAGQEPDRTRFAWRENHDIYGHDIVVDGKPYIQGVDLAACAMLCDQNPDCKGFSFDRWYGYCYLKREIAPSTVDPPSVMGVKLPKEQPPPSATAKMRMIISGKQQFHGTPITAPTFAGSRNDCSQQCSNHTSCFVYTFLVAQQRCLMFETTEGPYYNDAALSGYKQQEPIIPKEG